MKTWRWSKQIQLPCSCSDFTFKYPFYLHYAIAGLRLCYFDLTDTFTTSNYVEGEQRIFCPLMGWKPVQKTTPEDPVAPKRKKRVRMMDRWMDGRIDKIPSYPSTQRQRPKPSSQTCYWSADYLKWLIHSSATERQRLFSLFTPLISPFFFSLHGCHKRFHGMCICGEYATPLLSTNLPFKV